MARWEPDARGRMAEAALELYLERGYEQTTVAQIAERAGLTERTFFRHFADKREILFGGGPVLHELMVSTLAGVAKQVSPMDAVIEAVLAAGSIFDERREHSQRRQIVIAANPELQERELIKMASLGAALTEGLRQRGVPEPSASLAAQAGIAVFRVSFARWVEAKKSDKRTLPEYMRESFAELQAVTAPA